MAALVRRGLRHTSGPHYYHPSKGKKGRRGYPPVVYRNRYYYYDGHGRGKH